MSLILKCAVGLQPILPVKKRSRLLYRPSMDDDAYLDVNSEQPVVRCRSRVSRQTEGESNSFLEQTSTQVALAHRKIILAYIIPRLSYMDFNCSEPSWAAETSTEASCHWICAEHTDKTVLNAYSGAASIHRDIEEKALHSIRHAIGDDERPAIWWRCRESTAACNEDRSR